MSIFSQLKNGEINFAQAAQQIVAWAAKSPSAAAAASDLKQAASDAIAAGKTGIDYGLDQAILDAEALIDKFLTLATGRAGAALRPLEQAALQTAAGVLKAVIDAEIAKALAALSPESA